MTAGPTWIVTAKADYLPSHSTANVTLQTQFANQIPASSRPAPLRPVNVTCPFGQWP
jgi:hypothetical protein